MYISNTTVVTNKIKNKECTGLTKKWLDGHKYVTKDLITIHEEINWLQNFATINSTGSQAKICKELWGNKIPWVWTKGYRWKINHRRVHNINAKKDLCYKKKTLLILYYTIMLYNSQNHIFLKIKTYDLKVKKLSYNKN